MTPDWDRLAALAWSQIWQVTLVAVVVGALAMLVARRRPHLAHALWLLVILKCLMPPVWSSPTGAFSWAAAEPASPIAAASLPGIAVPEMNTPREQPEALPAGSRLAVEDEQVVNVCEATVVSPERPAINAVAWLGLLWMAGAAAYLLATLAAGFVWLRRLGRSRVEIARPLALAISDLSRRLHVRRKVLLRVTSEPIGPAVYGVFRPTLVLPAVLLSEKAGSSLDPILAHELVHVRRGDGLVCLLQWLAQAAWWFHPLVWWANRRLSQVRERCCDEEVLAALGCEPADYAKSLLDLLTLKHSLRPRLAFPGARPMEVTMKRLENIMDRTRRFSARTPRWCWAVLGVGLLLFLPGAALDGGAVTTTAPVGQEDKSSVAPASGVTAASSQPKAESRRESSPKQETAVESGFFVPGRDNAFVPGRDASVPGSPGNAVPRPDHRQPATDPNDLPALPAGFAEATGPIRPFDLLYIRAVGTLLDQPIYGYYLVDPEGQVNFGPAYGRVDLNGVALDEANRRCKKQLQLVLSKPFIKVKRIGRVTRWHKAIVPEGPYRIKVGDILLINVMRTLLDLPINNYYMVEPAGSVDLFVYGDPVVQGQTFDEAEKTITQTLKSMLVDPKTAVTMGRWKTVECPLPKAPYRIARGDLLQIRVLGTLVDQPVNNTLVVEPSGTVQLGPAYGRAKILGLSLVEAEKTIREHLKRTLANPHVSVTPAGWKAMAAPSGQAVDPPQETAPLQRTPPLVETDPPPKTEPRP